VLDVEDGEQKNTSILIMLAGWWRHIARIHPTAAKQQMTILLQQLDTAVDYY